MCWVKLPVAYGIAMWLCCSLPAKHLENRVHRVLLKDPFGPPPGGISVRGRTVFLVRADSALLNIACAVHALVLTTLGVL